ncbi:unnamed protein product [Prorocentrum cordatum]|uniref:Uncharacterized protein n=1 Tax=Prorocentrum cordatum TaxID=2364126 RepID=A0ABN9WKS2_9DINO|nr:unnamed protein product [Polarella glacialis]
MTRWFRRQKGKDSQLLNAAENVAKPSKPSLHKVQQPVLKPKGKDEEKAETRFMEAFARGGITSSIRRMTTTFPPSAPTANRCAWRSKSSKFSAGEFETCSACCSKTPSGLARRRRIRARSCVHSTSKR